MKTVVALKRRSFLRGLGTPLVVPAFESLQPVAAVAAGKSTSAGLATTRTGAPMRIAVVYFPNGAIQPDWWPNASKKTFELGRTMAVLEPLKSKFQVIRGLDHVHATPGPDGAGDHARASGTFLTGVRVRKTAGSDIRAGISIDQVIANQVGHLTRFPSLELTCDAVRKSGNCDSGYSCAYQFNLAWRSETTPISPEPNPRLLFERLFGEGPHGQRGANLKHRQLQQRSILDFVTEDARALHGSLGTRDQQKLDDYLNSVREVEKRVQKAEGVEHVPDPTVATPSGVPAQFDDYIGVMFDMLALAFETDSTRVATFLLANEGSNRAFPEVNISEGHHYLSHHQRKQEMVDKVAEIDRFYMKAFARFLQTMDSKKDVDGQSLLHNSMILYGSGCADGDAHSHNNLPALLAGAGGGTLSPGKYLQAPSGPMSNLFLSMADRFGLTQLERHGDSTGRLAGI
jgi:Protein of unknown function (DUF1552)